MFSRTLDVLHKGKHQFLPYSGPVRRTYNLVARQGEVGWVSGNEARTGGMHNESLMEFAWEASAYTAHVNL